MNKSFKIPINCIFCDSILKIEKNVEPQDGDLLKCHNCGRDNDVSSVRDFAIQELKKSEEFKKYIQSEISKKLKIKFK